MAGQDFRRVVLPRRHRSNKRWFLEIHESLIYSRFAISPAVLAKRYLFHRGVSYDEVCNHGSDYFA